VYSIHSCYSTENCQVSESWYSSTWLIHVVFAVRHVCLVWKVHDYNLKDVYELSWWKFLVPCFHMLLSHDPDQIRTLEESVHMLLYYILATIAASIFWAAHLPRLWSQYLFYTDEWVCCCTLVLWHWRWSSIGMCGIVFVFRFV